MPSVRFHCPKCNCELQVNVALDKEAIRIQCPKCQHAFNAKLPKPNSSASPRPATRPIQPQQDPFAGLSGADLSPTPMGRASSPIANDAGNAWQSPPKRRRSGNGNALKWVFGAIVCVGGLGLLVVAGVILYRNKDSISRITKTAIRLDSAESVAADLTKLRQSVENEASQISAADRESTGRAKLLAFLPQFDALALRASQLPPISRSVQDFETQREKMREEMRRFQATANAQPNQMQSTFWSLSGTAKKDSWEEAVNQVTSASMYVSSIADALVEFPDPITSDQTVFDWSDEDKRVLSVYRLQGELYRTLLAEFATVVYALPKQQIDIRPKTPAIGDFSDLSEPLKPGVAPDSKFSNLHAIVDATVAKAQSLTQLRSAQGSLLINVPKNSPYEWQYKSAKMSFESLAVKATKEGNLRDELKFIYDQIRAVDSKLEDIQFGRSQSIVKLAETKSLDRYQMFLADDFEVRKKERAKREAEKEQLNQTAEKEKLRKEREIQQQKEREAQVAQGAMPNSQEPRPGSPLAPGIPRLGPGQFGPPGMGGRFGPNGGPGSNGPGPGFGAPAFPGGAPGAMGGPLSGPGPAPGTTPAFEMTALGVTVQASDIPAAQGANVSSQIETSLKKQKYSLSISNSNLTLKIVSFDKPLKDLEQYLPMLEFVTINEATRTIDAKWKE